MVSPPFILSTGRPRTTISTAPYYPPPPHLGVAFGKAAVGNNGPSRADSPHCVPAQCTGTVTSSTPVTIPVSVNSLTIR